MKPCAKCKGPNERVGHRYCRACQAAYMREWRRTHKMTDEQRRQDRCRAYSTTMLRRGHLTRQPCIICGARAQMHHPDYDRPRLVIWLCRKHHIGLHRWQEGPTLNSWSSVGFTWNTADGRVALS